MHDALLNPAAPNSGDDAEKLHYNQKKTWIQVFTARTHLVMMQEWIDG